MASDEITGAGMTMRRITLALALLAATIGCGSAAELNPDADRLVDASDHVAGRADVTYFDLVKLIVTDLDPIGTSEPAAHQIVPYRHIEGKNSETVPGGPVSIKYLTPLKIHADGKSRLALLADLGPSDGNVAEFALLALFDLSGRPKLLDVVEVGIDRMTGFADIPLLPLGHGSDLIRVDSDHFNSDEDFAGTEFIFVRDDRFRLVDSLFTFDEKTCTTVRSQIPIITTRHYAGNAYGTILVAVREKLEAQPDYENCDDKKLPRLFVKYFRAAYRWNAHRNRFETTSRELTKLGAQNEKLMSGGAQ
jgi:hypothetical protein